MGFDFVSRAALVHQQVIVRASQPGIRDASQRVFQIVLLKRLAHDEGPGHADSARPSPSDC